MLMVITDPAARRGAVEASLAALRGGATALQVRWKGGATRSILELARELRGPTREHGALLIVNDRVDVALLAEADGAHLGADDLPLEAARRISPPGFLLGGSVDNAEEARQAERAGADYVGFGPIYRTGSKLDTGQVTGVDAIKEVRRGIRIPLVAIGGLNAERAEQAVAGGADGIAVLGAVMNADEPELETARIVSRIRAAQWSRRQGFA